MKLLIISTMPVTPPHRPVAVLPPLPARISRALRYVGLPPPPPVFAAASPFTPLPHISPEAVMETPEPRRLF